MNRYDSVAHALDAHIELASAVGDGRRPPRADYETSRLRFAEAYCGGRTNMIFPGVFDSLFDGVVFSRKGEEFRRGDRDPLDFYTNMVRPTEVSAVNEGQTVWIAEPICDIITEAASTAPIDALHADDLLSMSGFMVFAKPIPYMSVADDVRVPIRAVGWATTPHSIVTRDGEIGPGVHLLLYSDAGSLVTALDTDVPAGHMTYMAPGGLVLVDFLPWRFGAMWTPMAPGDDSVIDPDETRNLLSYHVDAFRRELMVLFRLCWQEILVPDREHVGRATLRRAQRVLPIPDDGAVVVLKLRKVARDTERTGETAHYTHRFIVRGHWRRLKRGTSAERAVWIRPFVKGDESLPLVVKHRVTSVSR